VESEERGHRSAQAGPSAPNLKNGTGITPPVQGKGALLCFFTSEAPPNCCSRLRFVLNCSIINQEILKSYSINSYLRKILH